MKPEFYALITAAAWGIGGYFEKRGLHLGGLSPQVGITLRTVVAGAVLSIVSFQDWGSLPRAGTKAMAFMIVGGGLAAGSLGMLCFYKAIKGAPLGRVMPIAFTSPLFGIAMGIALGGEALTWRGAAGACLTVGGIVLLTLG